MAYSCNTTAFHNTFVINNRDLQSQEKIKQQTKKAKKWIQQKIKENKVQNLCEDAESQCVTESEANEQVLDARKLLTRQLAKLEKSSESFELDNRQIVSR